MMREILFRGRRIDTGEWIEGFYYTHIGCRNGIRSVRHFIKAGDDAEYVDPSTVGQFTGLCDKNGKKIFEGDVLKENGYHFAAVFDRNWAKFKLQHDGKAIQYPEWNRGIRMEIIGNIHDNPELLAKEAD